VAAVGQARATLKLGQRDTIVAIAPFAHVMGFVITLSNALSVGAKAVTLPSFAFDAFVELIDRHRATVLVGPPPMMAGLAGHPAVDAHDLSCLELIVSGGAPVPAEIARAVGERLPGAVIRLGYGLTETAATATAPDRELAVAPGSVGRAMPSTELRVVDPENSADLGPGEAGELWVRGPQTMAGYLQRPDATAAMIDAEGWLRTGDLVVDEEGQVFIVDRLKELIKVNASRSRPPSSRPSSPRIRRSPTQRSSGDRTRSPARRRWRRSWFATRSIRRSSWPGWRSASPPTSASARCASSTPSRARRRARSRAAS
jgi:acyl-CoA synthetase (AMP-forming)/AMP-acid ligase II